MRKVVIITGLTGSGKSGLAVKIAKEFNGEIISADSVQIYKGLDIGSECIIIFLSLNWSISKPSSLRVGFKFKT